MKNQLAALAILISGIPSKAAVEPEIHKLCSKAADYAGCVSANSSSSPEASKSEKGAKKSKGAAGEKRTYSINVFKGAATQTCFMICSNNSEDDQAEIIPKCFARDESMISSQDFNQYLQEQGPLVSVVATSPEEKFTLYNNNLGQLSSYAACHYRPTVVEVYSADICDAPKRKDQQSKECQNVTINLVSLDRVEGKEAAKGKGFIQDWIGQVLLLPGKILNATNVRRYDSKVCTMASKDYLERKMSTAYARSFVHVHHSIIDQLKAAKLVRVESESNPRGFEMYEQYKKGIFRDETGPIGTRQRTLCSFGKSIDGVRGDVILQASVREKDLSRVKKILQARRLPFMTQDGVIENLGSGYFAGFSFDRSSGKITDLTHNPAKEQLKIGDEIISINGIPIKDWVADFDSPTTLDMKIKRDGKTLNKPLATKLQNFSD